MEGRCCPRDKEKEGGWTRDSEVGCTHVDQGGIHLRARKTELADELKVEEEVKEGIKTNSLVFDISRSGDGGPIY